MSRLVTSVALCVALATLAHAIPEVVDISVTSPVIDGFEYTPRIELAWAPETFVADQTIYCRYTKPDGTVVAEASFPATDEDGLLTTSAICAGFKVEGLGVKSLFVELSYTPDFAEFSSFESRQRAIPGVITIIPPALTILLAVTTQNVLVSLFCGIWSAAFLIHSFDPFRGFLRAIDTYVLGSLADEGHAYVIMFDWFLAGVVALMTRSGGAQGLADGIVKYAKTRKMTMFFCFLCGCAIFFDDYSNTLIVGSTFRPVFDMVLISREKLAFIVDATGAPVCSISPISSWIGYELDQINSAYDGVLEAGGNLDGYDTSAFLTFIKTIPGRYYPIGMILLQIMLILTQRDFGYMLSAERRAINEGKVVADDADAGQVAMAAELEAKEGAPKRIINAIVPIGLIILFVFLGLIFTGLDATQADPDLTSSVTNVFGNADSYSALLWSTLAVSIFTWIWLRCQYYVPFDEEFNKSSKIMWFFNKVPGAVPVLHFVEAIDTWIEGIKGLMSTILVLILAWAIGDVLKVLGTDDFVSSGISGGVDKRAIPVLTFILSALLSTAIGTSFGTMAIMFPTGVKTAYFADPGNQDLMLGTIASILTGSVFGDHVSPISDTTILSALSSRCDLMHHVRTQAPYAILVGLNSIIFGDLLSGFLYPMWVGLLVSAVTTLASAFLLSAPTHSDKQDLFGRLGLYKCMPKSKSKGKDYDSASGSDKDREKGGLTPNATTQQPGNQSMPGRAQNAGAVSGEYLA